MSNSDTPHTRKIVLLNFSKTHLMDLAGPAQVFYEGDQIGSLGLSILFAAQQPKIRTEQGLEFAGLKDVWDLQLDIGDFLIIPGIDFATFARGELDEEIKRIRGWLQVQIAAGVSIATICSGSLILAEAGLLDGISCTSHWKCLSYLEEHYPGVHVLSDRLFVKDGNIYSSAGMTSGIDMSLAILEELYNPILVSKVAREMVVYIRRNRESGQESLYLDYQTHFNPAIHKVQNYIISNPEQNPTLEELSDFVHMSVRNLTRLFKKTTGRTVTEFKHDVKFEYAKTFLNNPELTVETISRKCGFSDPRQLSRIWVKKTGKSISEYRDSL